MRGGYQHNQMQVARLKREATDRGGHVRTEHAVCGPGISGFIDLVVDFDEWRLVIEVERSTHRVGRDLAKAAAVCADELWIVTPEFKTAEAVRRKLHRLHVPARGRGIFVFTQGQAVEQIRRRFPLFSASYSSLENRKNGKAAKRSPGDKCEKFKRNEAAGRNGGPAAKGKDMPKCACNGRTY